MVIARRGHGRAVEAFEPLGVAALHGEGSGDVVGDVLGAELDGAQAHHHAAEMDRDVGHFGPHLDQRDAEFALLLAEASERGRDGRSDDRFDSEMSLADHGVDIAQRRRFGGDHVDVDAETIGMEPDRLLNPLGAVNHVQRRVGVENDLAVAVDRVLAGAQQLVDVGLLDRVPAKLDFNVGDIADEPSGAVARPHVIDREAGHAFGELDRFSDGKLAGRHIGDKAALDPAAFALPGAEDREPPLMIGACDHGADLRRADIERRNQRLIGDLRH